MATAAVFAAHGPGATERLESRARCRVDVDAPDPWRTTVAERLGVAGLVVADPAHGLPTATLLVTLGEPRRSRVDGLVRDDRTHLLVALLPDRVRLGPFVVPGTTACLRCLDAHLAEHDPRRGLVLEQLEDRDDPPAPCDPVLAHAGLALAVRELTTYAEGDRPATWSATLTLGADLALPRREWPRHPHCGCTGLTGLRRLSHSGRAGGAPGLPLDTGTWCRRACRPVAVRFSPVIGRPPPPR